MAAVGLPVWTPGVWADTVWAEGVWASESTVVVTGGAVWAMVNGVSIPPATQSAGAAGQWSWVNGAVRVPPGGTRPAFPREWR